MGERSNEIVGPDFILPGTLESRPKFNRRSQIGDELLGKCPEQLLRKPASCRFLLWQVANLPHSFLNQ